METAENCHSWRFARAMRTWNMHGHKEVRINWTKFHKARSFCALT